MKKLLLGLMLTLNLGLSVSAFASSESTIPDFGTLPITNKQIGPGMVGKAEASGLRDFLRYNITCQLNTKSEGVHLLFGFPKMTLGSWNGITYIWLNGEPAHEEMVLKQGVNTVGLIFARGGIPGAELTFKNLDKSAIVELSSCSVVQAS